MDLTVINHNGSKVIDSREVALMIGKEHRDLLESIRGYVKYLDCGKFRTHDFFISSTYFNTQNKEQPCYLLTRKGCDMVANKMTGEKGVLFTATYVTKFEEMESRLNLEGLSPQLQLLIRIEQEQNALRGQIAEVSQIAQKANDSIENIRGVITLDASSWREETTKLINSMAKNLGGTDHIRELRSESYQLLDKRLGVSLETRLKNKRMRMADEGASKTKRDNLNYLDVIAEDKKLVEGYVAIIKEMAVKHGAERSAS